MTLGTATISDSELWETLRLQMTDIAFPIFLEAFMRGARAASHEDPVAEAAPSETVEADPELTPAVGFRQISFDEQRIAAQSLAVVQNYTDTWWQQIANTTQHRMRDVIATSIQEGTGVNAVIRQLSPLFGRTRAELIAVSETTNLMGMGAQATYRDAGFTTWEWRTVEDARVCPICRPLNGRQFPMSTPFRRAHPRCRCWPVPVGDPTPQIAGLTAPPPV